MLFDCIGQRIVAIVVVPDAAGDVVDSSEQILAFSGTRSANYDFAILAEASVGDTTEDEFHWLGSLGTFLCFCHDKFSL